MIKLRKRGKRYSLWGEYLGVKIQESTGLTCEDAASEVLLRKLREIELDNPVLAKAYQLRELTRVERKSVRESKPVLIGDWSRVNHWKVKDMLHVYTNDPSCSGNTTSMAKTVTRGLLNWDLPRTKVEVDRVFDHWRSIARTPLSDSSVNRYLGIFRAMCNYVERWEREHGGNSDYRAPTMVALPEPDLEDIFLTQDEVTRLLDIIKERWPNKLAIYVCLVYTGARPVELARLKWDDVFLRNDLTSSSLVLKNYKGKTKQLRKRSVPIHPLVYETLNEIPGHDRYGFVFKNQFGGGYTIVGKDGQSQKPHFCKHPWQKARELADLPEGTTLYHLRHTFASWLRFKGHQLDTIRRLMGHQNIQTTMRYASLHPDDLASAVQSL